MDMRTSILYGRNYNRRSFLPAEIPTDERQAQAYSQPRFFGAHSYEAETISITDAGLKSNGKETVHRPDQIIIGDYSFTLGLVKNRIAACKPFKSDGGICGAVVIGPEYVARIDALDNQIER